MTQQAAAQNMKGRESLPGGGSVLIPSPYRVTTDYPNHSDRAPEARIAYRNWRSTMSGHPECDGMLGVGRPTQFKSLKDFMQTCRAALSTHWSAADEIPGQPWTGNEKKFEIAAGQGPNGEELTCQLAVNTVGFFRVYDEPAHMYAVRHKAGVDIAIWLQDKHGGINGARRIADRIAASFQA